ncbi:hypothetical protein ACX1DW_01475 [Stutzerimonas sp. KH-1]|jgi:hypothetical protein
MSDESSFSLWMLALFLLVSLTWIFNDQTAAPNHIEWAQESCAANGGLEKLSVDLFYMSAACANGAVFESGKPGPQQVKP